MFIDFVLLFYTDGLSYYVVSTEIPCDKSNDCWFKNFSRIGDALEGQQKQNRMWRVFNETS